MPACGQCGKPAIMEINNVPLCVDCNLKFEQAQELEIQRHRTELDHLADYMESVTGVSGVIPRYGKPAQTVHTGPVTFNNIRVDRSIVGAINTGAMAKLDVIMSGARNYGDQGQPIANALQNLTQAVVDSAELQVAAKNEIIENLAFVVEQLTQNGSVAKDSGPFKAVMDKLNAALNAVSTLSDLWSAVQAILTLGG